MDSKLVRFFNKIGLKEEEYSCFSGAKLENVIVDNNDQSWSLYISLDKMIDVNTFNLLCTKSENIKETRRIYFIFKHATDEYINDYVNYIFKIYQEKCPMLSGVSSEDITINENIINIKVTSKSEEEKINTIKPKLIEFMSRMGYLNLKLVPILDEEKQKEVTEMLKQKDYKMEEINIGKKQSTLIIGNEIKGKPFELKNIIAEMSDVVVEVFVFGVELKETNKGFNIITYKISDYTDSLFAKIFTKDKEITKTLMKRVTEGSWYKMRGYVKNDSFSGELVLNIRDIETFDRNTVKRVDEAEGIAHGNGVVVSVLRGIVFRNGKYAEFVVHLAEGSNIDEPAHVKQLSPFEECLVHRRFPDIGKALVRIRLVIGDHDGFVFVIKIEHMGEYVCSRRHIGVHCQIGYTVAVRQGDLFACAYIMNVNIIGFGTECPLVFFVHYSVAVTIAADTVAAADLRKGVEIPFAVACQGVEILGYTELAFEILVEYHAPGALVVIGVYIAHDKIKMPAERKVVHGVLIPPGGGKINGGDILEVVKVVLEREHGGIAGGIENYVVFDISGADLVAHRLKYRGGAVDDAVYFAVVIVLHAFDNGFLCLVDRIRVFFAVKHLAGVAEYGIRACAKIRAENAEFAPSHVLYGNVRIAVLARGAVRGRVGKTDIPVIPAGKHQRQQHYGCQNYNECFFHKTIPLVEFQ